MVEKLDRSKLVINWRHPSYVTDQHEWEKWRCTYKGGEEFRNKYLEKFSKRESPLEFQLRRKLTPIPTFAKAAINDIRNAIFQRMGDVIRRGGSDTYHNAVAGLNGGVDNRGSTMNSFLGQKVLTDLLVMGRVGVFVDMPVISGLRTLADSNGAKPYLYVYQVEDILSWSYTKSDDISEFQSVLLRDTCMNYDSTTLLPTGTVQRYRKLWIDDQTGFVNLQFYNADGEPTDRDGYPSTEPIQLELRRIPFVMLDILDSLIKDVADHQIALLNLGSSDINYALQSNFPFYTEQRASSVGHHLKRVPTETGTASTGGQGSDEEAVTVGVTQGRYYDKGMERPAFINPSSEPLEASLKLQEKLEKDIRKLVNLAVENIGNRVSAASKAIDNQGLDAGLSFIGLVLAAAERRIGEFWAAYEERDERKRKVPIISYPDRYSLKTDSDRINETKELAQLIHTVPSRTAKKEISKICAATLLEGKVSTNTLQTIFKEIDEAPYTTSDPDVIRTAKEAGLCGEKVASMALGFNPDEYLTAREDHTARIKRIAEAQGQNKTDPGARGVLDLSANPESAGREEKEASRQTDLKDTTKVPVRGEGK